MLKEIEKEIKITNGWLKPFKLIQLTGTLAIEETAKEVRTQKKLEARKKLIEEYENSLKLLNKPFIIRKPSRVLKPSTGTINMNKPQRPNSQRDQSIPMRVINFSGKNLQNSALASTAQDTSPSYGGGEETADNSTRNKITQNINNLNNRLKDFENEKGISSILKMQSCFRGYLSRKQLQKKNTSLGGLQLLHKRSKSISDYQGGGISALNAQKNTLNPQREFIFKKRFFKQQNSERKHSTALSFTNAEKHKIRTKSFIGSSRPAPSYTNLEKMIPLILQETSYTGSPDKKSKSNTDIKNFRNGINDNRKVYKNSEAEKTKIGVKKEEDLNLNFKLKLDLRGNGNNSSEQYLHSDIIAQDFTQTNTTHLHVHSQNRFNFNISNPNAVQNTNHTNASHTSLSSSPQSLEHSFASSLNSNISNTSLGSPLSNKKTWRDYFSNNELEVNLYFFCNYYQFYIASLSDH